MINKAAVDPTGGTNPVDPIDLHRQQARRPAARSRRARSCRPPSSTCRRSRPRWRPATAPLEAGEQIQWTFLGDEQEPGHGRQPRGDRREGRRGDLPGHLARAERVDDLHGDREVHGHRGRRDRRARSTTPRPRPATLPGCTGAIGSATCPTVPSNPSSTKTPTISSPTITVNTVLGSNRYDNGDQFTESIRTGWAGGRSSATRRIRPPRGTGSTVDARHGHDRHLRRHHRHRLHADDRHQTRTARSTPRR